MAEQTLFDVGPPDKPNWPEWPRKACTPAPIGSGPEDEKCGTCLFAQRFVQSKTWFKCRKSRSAWTGGKATDIKTHWPACSEWEPLKVNRIVPVGWDKPESPAEWRIAADYWEERSNQHKAALCRDIANTLDGEEDAGAAPPEALADNQSGWTENDANTQQFTWGAFIEPCPVCGSPECDGTHG